MAPQPNRRPNIVITMADDQQASSLFGAHVHTPTLDAMRAEGSCFTQAHHFGASQGAVCAPSRAMLHSGKYYFNLPDALHLPSRTPPRNERDLAALQATPLLGELLGANGYKTFATGKWHNGPFSFNKSFQDGASIFFGGMSDHDNVPLHPYDSSGTYPDEAIQFGEGFSTDLFVDAATTFIDSYNSDAPFFLLVSFTAPHDPRTPLPEYRTMYDAEDIDLPENYLSEHPFDNGEMLCRDELLAPFPRPVSNVKRQMAEYYGMITHMDRGIGRVREALEAKGFLDHTLFVHTGDHGLSVGQHGLFGKQNLYEHSIKTPLVMTGPDVPRGKESDALVYQHDLFPTLLETAGVNVPDNCDFKSLWPHLGQTAEERDSLFSSYRRCQRSIKGERFKLIRYFEEGGKGTNTLQLFDYRNDPLETLDLRANASYRGEIAALDEMMLEWMKKSNDPLAEKLGG